MRILFSIFLLLILSCNQSTSNELALAQVGDEQLLPSDVAGIMPEDLHGTDSIAFCKAYIQQWIQEQVMTMEAKKLPEPADMNVKIDRYKNQLFVQTLREKIISERISENQNLKADSSMTGLSEAAQQESKRWRIWQQYQEEVIKKYEAEGLIKKP